MQINEQNKLWSTQYPLPIERIQRYQIADSFHFMDLHWIWIDSKNEKLPKWPSLTDNDNNRCVYIVQPQTETQNSHARPLTISSTICTPRQMSLRNFFWNTFFSAVFKSQYFENMNEPEHKFGLTFYKLEKKYI